MGPSSQKNVVGERVASYFEYKCLLPSSAGSNRRKLASTGVRKACKGSVVTAYATPGAVSHGMDVQGEGLVPPTPVPAHPSPRLHEVAHGNGVRGSRNRAASRRIGEILAVGVGDA